MSFQLPVYIRSTRFIMIENSTFAIRKENDLF
ncbi:Uncharacterised protein [Serratia proteamaculans]|nr:Uncharacterised protein [Serratia proteamaculans]